MSTSRPSDEVHSLVRVIEVGLVALGLVVLVVVAGLIVGVQLVWRIATRSI